MEIISNLKINKWTIVSDIPILKKGKKYYNCECECGNTKLVYFNDLKNGKSKGCGCKIPIFSIGQKFNLWTIINSEVKNKNKKYYIECRCICGIAKYIHSVLLLSGKSKSCGCLGLDLFPGSKFGKWTIIDCKILKNGKSFNLCKCDCGLEKYVNSSTLRSGRSHGCLRCTNNKSRLLHGKTKTRLHNIWVGMRTRCNNSNHHSYKNYGALGIKVSELWDDFDNFQKWSIENNYDDTLEIDRINSSLDYCPENCRWVTPKKNRQNRSNVTTIDIDGINYTANELANINNISLQTLLHRLRSNKSPNDILNKNKLNCKYIEIFGELSRCSVSIGCLRTRIHRGWSFADAISKPKQNFNSPSDHAQSGSRLYNIWQGIKQRCNNKNSKSFTKYGAKNISICNEWSDNFSIFYEWSHNNGYKECLALDRIDNSLGYNSDNCRWVTPGQNNRNKTNNNNIEAWGETKCLSDWCSDSRCKSNQNTIRQRIQRGWSTEKAISTPPQKQRSKNI